MCDIPQPRRTKGREGSGRELPHLALERPRLSVIRRGGEVDHSHKGESRESRGGGHSTRTLSWDRKDREKPDGREGSHKQLLSVEKVWA